MTTAHNEHTGASLTTAGKGSLEKYAQGWDAIFKPEKQECVGEYTWTLENGSTVSFKGDPNGYSEWTGFSESAVVMALDFHGSQPEENMCCSVCGYSWCECGFQECTHAA